MLNLGLTLVYQHYTFSILTINTKRQKTNVLLNKFSLGLVGRMISESVISSKGMVMCSVVFKEQCSVHRCANGLKDDK